MQSRDFCASFQVVLQLVLTVALSVVAAPLSEAANPNYRSLSRASVTPMAYSAAVGSRNGLPATVMDSFVGNAIQNGRADAIYGDEGTGAAPPPFFGFTAQHRINAGIVGQQDAGLTTGHGSRLPDAWGRDEYLGGQEWSQSGSNNGAYDKIVSPDIQVVASAASYDFPPVAPSFRRFDNSAASSDGGAGGVSPVNSHRGSGSAADSGF